MGWLVLASSLTELKVNNFTNLGKIRMAPVLEILDILMPRNLLN